MKDHVAWLDTVDPLMGVKEDSPVGDFLISFERLHSEIA